MAIQGTNPVTISTTYDTYWMVNLNVRSFDPNGKTTVEAILRPYTQDEYGVITLVEGVAPIRYQLGDLFAAAATDPELATIIGTLEAKVQKLAQAQGLI